MLESFKQALHEKRRTIVFPEGTDYRILNAADSMLREDLADVILLGVPAEIRAAAVRFGNEIGGAALIEPAASPDLDEMAAAMAELRKGKMTLAQCRDALCAANYFGTMLVKLGKADALLGGATYSTADTVRPALQLIKTKPGNSLVCCCMIFVRTLPDGTEQRLAMGDCVVNMHPDEDALVEIANETAKCAERFGIDPKVAFLSFSTNGSASDPGVTLMHNAAQKAKAVLPYPVDGEMQFDAAVDPEVGQRKFPGSPVAGYANTFILPDVSSGNIAYKITSKLGGFAAYPILCGLNAPINDLSRGSTLDEVYKMAVITAALA